MTHLLTQSKIIPVYFSNFMTPGNEMVFTQTQDWRKLYPSDGNGLTNWALRSIVVIKGESVILFDTGFGNKQSAEFFSQFYLNGDFTTDEQLSKHGLSVNDITDVVLTHLHFDHCGGCLLKENGSVGKAFPNAHLWISQKQWDTAMNPSEKEKESFLEENIKPLTEHYPVRFVDEGSYLPGIYFKLVNGHTQGQIIPIIRHKDKTYVFAADLFPSSIHIDPAVNMIYDMDIPLVAKEKQQMLEECLANNYVLIFQHGMHIEACTLERKKNEISIIPVRL